MATHICEYDVVDLPDKLNIKNITHVHDLILSKLTKGRPLSFTLPVNAEVDLSFVQIIEAARIQAKSSGVSLRLSSAASGAVLDVLERGGFREAFSAEDKTFWLHQEAIQ
ncbi:STAS domain-containing protein [Pararhizobium sp. O133]|uniref:STAS domain-containing protein n=1 Tax=Pararhizobium sp. O133 TaxID=3449278 RepID=UPI003F687644